MESNFEIDHIENGGGVKKLERKLGLCVNINHIFYLPLFQKPIQREEE